MQDKAPMAERIMRTADHLFYQRGIRAVGVDTVAAEAGISKRSLYDYFPSKDALVAAYLERRFYQAPESSAPPGEQILAAFDRLTRLADTGEFRGCPFVNAVAELGEGHDAEREIAVRFKEQRWQWYRARLREAGAADPDTLATQIAVLMDGAIAVMLVRPGFSVVPAARAAARTLMLAAGVALPD